LAGKVALFALLAVAARGVLVAGVALDASRALFRRTLEGSFPGHADRCAARVNGWLGLATGDALRAAGEPAIAAGATNARALENALARTAVLDGLWVIDADGRLRAAAGTPPPFETTLPEALRIPGVHAAIGTSGEAVPIALAPLRGGGFVGGHAQPGAITALLSGNSLPGIGGAFLTDASGRVLFRGRAGSASGEPLPIAALLGQHGPTAEWTDSEGVERIAAVRRLARSGWHVAVVGDIAEGFAPILAMLGRLFLLDTGLVLAAAWLAWRLTARLVRPVEALWDGAHRIAQGDLEVEVVESHSSDEIAELTRTFNAMARKLRDDQREIDAAAQQLRLQNQALQAANEVLAQLSITDGLTRLHNHRFFQEHLTRELKRVQRTGEPLAMLLIDLDDFKALNDRWGHAAGDAILARTGTVMNANVRESDLLARYGGEEFVVLAPIDIEGAVVLAEKLRMAVERELLALEEADGPLHVTVSIGVARFRGDRKAFFRDADRALYAAKSAGKNCVVVEAETIP
jgi:diguanylate cyclase (GGDEF)-like protein